MAKEKLGGLTGSERVKATGKKRGRPRKSESPDKSALEALQQGTKAITDTVGAVADGVQTVTNAGKQVRRAFGGGSGLVSGDSLQATNQAQDLAAQYGLQLDDLSKTIGGSNYEIDESIPEIDAKEANRLNLIIERQNNALDVAGNRIKQKRKQVRNHKDEWELVGDLVDLDTTRINVGTKVLKHEIAGTKFQIEQSKLEETEEYLEQQVIKTQGVISLTEGIRTEWDLRFQKQERQLEKLQIEIEQVDNDNARQREKLESFLFNE
ncbi:hypothetical protein Riv7116_6914 (plasmid) [Rivularia sp. PCC 7116]|uniref:hypothetical protein n=1 Tax=Rivularia sp. PCC 7116 TaxID=373994 RepID=UPI00029F1772|nr:hypothetical protein [Rivularia sp. PCC 7116]AFY59226.1 hypothetical protein Riv7116_6914 [Rivularia sp. PCC 7116]